MLSLAEETLLLLYLRVRPPNGGAEYDTLTIGGGDVRLLAGATLMDLALHGRVQVKRAALWARLTRPVAAAPIALVVGLPALVVGAGMRLPTPLFWVSSVILLLCGLAASALIERALADKLMVTHGSPVGDHILDQVLWRVEKVGREAPIRTYLWRCFERYGLPKMRAQLAAELEQRGYVSSASEGPTIRYLRDRRVVQREQPEFQAIGERLRRLTLDGTSIDPRAVALLLLLGRGVRVLRVRGTQGTNGIYQFFAPSEYARVRARLRELRKGDAAVAAQLGPDLYQSLRIIALEVEQRRHKDTTAG